MQNIPVAVRQTVEKRCSRFAEAVKVTRLNSGGPVQTSLDEFPEEDMALVYACLWYAQSEGVDITFIASKPR